MRRIVYVLSAADSIQSALRHWAKYLHANSRERRLQYVKPRVHKRSTRNFGYSQLTAESRYGRIVVIGVGDADAIGETVGGGTG